MKRLTITFAACFLLVATAFAQRDWMTDSADAQRSAWLRSDGKINKDSMAKPGGFQFLWKMKLNNPARQLNGLTPPATLERLIGYHGFRMLGFMAGSSGKLITIDTDLGRLEWEKQLPGGSGAGTLNCPGGITTSVVRPTLTSIAPAPISSGGGGRQTPGKGDVGEPGQGAVTLKNVRPAPNFNMGAMMPQNTRVNPANPPGGQFGAGPFLVYALGGDGKLYVMHLSNGQDFEAAIPFVPANANANGLIIVDQVAYVVTEQNCGGAANGLWALDLLTKEVKTFKANVVGSTGVAFGDNNTIYVTTGSGGDKPNSLVALDQKTLAVKGSYSSAQEFSSSPVVISHKGKLMVAAATKDGRVHLFNAENLQAPVASSAASKAASPGALASWQDLSGTRWILAPTDNTVVAWKVSEEGGLSLQQGWASRELVAPLPPTIINGVAFVTSSGEFRSSDSKMTAAQRAGRSKAAVIYALDAVTGKELWNSGATITSFAHGNALSGGMGQLYLTTYDGTIYTFGFPMEH